MVNMGFPGRTVESAIRWFDEDEKMVLDFCVQTDQLAAGGHSLGDVYEAFELLYSTDATTTNSTNTTHGAGKRSVNHPKVVGYLVALRNVREVGFTEDEVKEALRRTDPDHHRPAPPPSSGKPRTSTNTNATSYANWHEEAVNYLLSK